jgi:hypothetical protein
VKDILIHHMCTCLVLLRAVREATPNARSIGQMGAAIHGSLVTWTEVEA